jgi:hypothetical protein
VPDIYMSESKPWEADERPVVDKVWVEGFVGNVGDNHACASNTE